MLACSVAMHILKFTTLAKSNVLGSAKLVEVQEQTKLVMTTNHLRLIDIVYKFKTSKNS